MRAYFQRRRAIDWVASLIVSATMYFDVRGLPKIFLLNDAEAFRDVMVFISASSLALVGFVLAASTFLISFTQREELSLLRNSAGYRQLIEIIRSSMWRLLALAVIAGLSAVIAPDYQELASSIVLFFVSMALLATGTMTWSTLAILSLEAR